jgi:hypothetical protein
MASSAGPNLLECELILRRSITGTMPAFELSALNDRPMEGFADIQDIVVDIDPGRGHSRRGRELAPGGPGCPCGGHCRFPVPEYRRRRTAAERPDLTMGFIQSSGARYLQQGLVSLARRPGNRKTSRLSGYKHYRGSISGLESRFLIHLLTTDIKPGSEKARQETRGYSRNVMSN